jgi:tetratricopeptide (TPR) repeat protein|nr:Copper-translocating P-type ATPase [Methylocystis sp. SC2]
MISRPLRLALAGFFLVLLAATASAQSDRWARCRGRDTDARIAGCTEVIDRLKRQSRRDQFTAYFNRGGAYRAKGDLDRALADLNNAVKLYPKAASALAERASIFKAKGDFDKAIADYDASIAERPNAVAFLGRGEAYRAKNDFDPAIADYDKAIALDPQLADAFVSRAKAYLGKEDLERAKQDLEAALKLDPRLASANAALDEVTKRVAERVAASAAPTTSGPIAEADYASPDRLIVVVAGFVLIAFIVWFFWLKRATGMRATETSSGYQEAMILVKGGYTPDTIIVRRGKPVRLNFRREETASCSDKVIFADFQKSAELPTGETVAVEFLPKESGEFNFACPMGMFRGRLVVE